MGKKKGGCDGVGYCAGSRDISLCGKSRVCRMDVEGRRTGKGK